MIWPSVVIYSVLGVAIVAALNRAISDNFMSYPPVKDDRSLAEICEDLNAEHREQDRERDVIPQMKYIVYNRGGEETAVIFSQNSDHERVANAMCMRKDLVSAGFLMITEKGAKCYGVSSSLNMRARPEDAVLINRMSGYED